MNGLLSRYFDSLSEDLLGRRVGQPADGVRPADWRERAERVHAARASDDRQQKGIFREIQALMCLLEGYSNHVMDHVGAKMLPGYATLKVRFEDRQRHRSLGEHCWRSSPAWR